MDLFPTVKYTKEKTKDNFEHPHDSDRKSCASLLSCILIKTYILRTFIGQHHNLLWCIYVRDIQSPMFVHAN